VSDRPAQRLVAAGESLARLLETHAWLPLGGCCAVLIWLSLRASAARPFWFDELLTFHTARLPDFAALWLALSRAADIQPPLFYVTTAAAQKLFGSSEVATRLPALAGYLLMTVCLYLFVRRRTNVLFGCVAALFPAVTEAFRYSYEARPYGLLLGFSALALLCWQRAISAGTAGHRKFALAGLWLSVSLAVSFHYYAVLVLIPIAIGEAVRVLRRRALDIPIAVAAGLGGLVVVVYLPLIRAGVAVHSGHPWNTVTPRLIFDAFQFALGPAAVPLAFSFVALYPLHWLDRVAEPSAEGTGLTADETGACLGFVLLPAFGYLVGRAFTHMLAERYVISLVVGFAVRLRALSGDGRAGARRTGFGRDPGGRVSRQTHRAAPDRESICGADAAPAGPGSSVGDGQRPRLRSPTLLRQSRCEVSHDLRGVGQPLPRSG